MQFENPMWFVAAAVVALGAVIRVVYRQAGLWRRPSILFSNLPAMMRPKPTLRTRLFKGFGIVRVLILILLVVSLARPRLGRSDSVITSEGIDIMMVVDASGSMAAEDFGKGQTRLFHVTEVMKEFARGRKDDRIGIISFGAYAYTRCPMTLDYGLLEQFFDQVLKDWEVAYDSLTLKQSKRRRAEIHLTPQEANLEGTAIGDALVAAAGRLQESTAKGKVIVLLTDGASNAGEAEPGAAAELAAEFGIKVYTVGAGSNRPVPVTVYDRFGRKVKMTQRFPLDEETLEKIATTSDGRYFNAQNRERLEEVYREIDRLERAEIQTKNYREWDERFAPFALGALALLLLEAVLAATVFRTIP